MELEHLPTQRQLLFDESPEEGDASVAEHVLYNTALRELNIENAWFGDDNAEELGAALANNTTLCELTFKSCTFGERGLKGIAEALETNATLRIIHFDSMRQIGDAGAGIMAHALASTTSLETLHMSDCDIGALGCRAIADALKINTSLKKLDISSNKHIGDGGATALADALASSSTLTELYLSGCDISSLGCRAIADALASTTSLASLCLGHCGIGALGCRVIADALRINTSLQILVFWGNKDIGDGGTTALAFALASSSTLRQLSLRACGVGALGCRVIAEALRINTSLEMLEINCNEKIGNGGATALADALASTSSLTKLRIDYCGIGALGCRALADALRINASLKKLDIGGNRMVQDTGATALADALATTSSLTNLRIDECGIGSLGCRAIADALRINTSLTTLDIGNNEKIRETGTTALAFALSSTTSLTSLSLDYCGIGALGCRALADALKISTSLKQLDIDGNIEIGDAGATALADALASTSSLTELEVHGCDIGREGALALGRAWGQNLALSLDFKFETTTDILTAIREEAGRVRAAIHRRDSLLAFAMGMHDRLGGGPRAQARTTFWNISSFLVWATRSTRRMCPYHFMCAEVFKLVGDAYE